VAASGLSVAANLEPPAVDAAERYLELARRLSHEFGGPLTVLAGYLDLLRNGDLGETEQLGEAELDGAQGHVSRLRSLAGGIIRATRIRTAGDSVVIAGSTAAPTEELLAGCRELSATLAGWTTRPLPPAQRRALEVSTAKSVQLTCLASQFAYTRTLLPDHGALALECVDLGRWVRALVHAVGPVVAASGHRMLYTGPAGPAPVALEVRSMELALLNLIDNAQKFSPADSTISATVQRLEASAVVQVTDEGPGLPEGYRIRPFGRIDVPAGFQAPGFGLGLSIVSHVVALHQGTVRLGAGPRGTGTTVRLALPLSEDESGD
jgi:signal transduction histidine kinase